MSGFLFLLRESLTDNVFLLIFVVVFGLFQFRNYFHLVTERILFLVSHGPEINVLQPLIVVIGEFLEILHILRRFANLKGLVSLLQIEVVLRRELDGALPLLVVNDNEYLLVAQATELYCLLEEAPLSFTERDIPLQFILNQLELINLFLTHLVLVILQLSIYLF